MHLNNYILRKCDWICKKGFIHSYASNCLTLRMCNSGRVLPAIFNYHNLYKEVITILSLVAIIWKRLLNLP